MNCNKTKYAKQEYADKDIERIAKVSVRQSKPIRSYFCEKCNGWHLSSHHEKKDILIAELENENARLLLENKIFKKDALKQDRVVLNAIPIIKELRYNNTKLNGKVKQLQQQLKDMINKFHTK